MYKEVLRSIENIEIYPIISLLIFVLFFLCVFLWAMKLPKEHIDYMKSMPMDDEKLTKNQP